MGTLIGIRGIGDSIWSKGINLLAERLHKRYGWDYEVFNWHDSREILEYLNSAKPPIVVVGHSMGVDTGDRLVEKYGRPVAAFVSVDSAWPETLPDNVDKVYSVTASTFGRFNVKGGRVNLQKVIQASHTTIDDSEELYSLMERVLGNLSITTIAPVQGLGHLEEQLRNYLDPQQETPRQKEFFQAFFSNIRKEVGRLTQEEVDGYKRFIWFWEKYHQKEPIEYLASILANVYRETGGRIQPVRETFASSDAQARNRLENAWSEGKLPWVKRPYWRDNSFGRGDIQLTHDVNYKKNEKLLEERYDIKVPLGSDYSLALHPVISVAVAVGGMLYGSFTGKKLSDYMLPGTGFDFRGSRAIVNGDTGLVGNEIERLGETFFVALSEAHREAGVQPPVVDPIPPEIPPVEPPEADIERILRLTEENNQMLKILLSKGTGITALKKESKKMTWDIFRPDSKTFWVGVAMVVAGLSQYIMPETSVWVELAKSFFGDVSAGLLISNGLAIIFGREAIAKNGAGK